MPPRNIHGLWIITFEQRLIHSEVAGPSNKEMANAWFDEVKQNVESSPQGYAAPWAILHDCRKWDLASPDMWGSVNTMIDWLAEHNCVLAVLVFSKKIQHFAAEHGFNDQEIVQFSYDFDQALQNCKEKLSEGTCV